MTLSTKTMMTLYPTKNHNAVYIGGPGTMLPFWLESLLAWSLAISCLGVALYHWMKQLILPDNNDKLLPLTTHSRREFQERTAIQRYQQLTRLLEQHKPIKEWTDKDLIEHVQSNHIVRRLVSLVMLQKSELEAMDLVRQLERIWPLLVELPSTTKKYPFEISIILPVYKEDGRLLVAKLQAAQDLAVNPSQIEVILVNAGHCTHLEQASQLKFGKIQCVPGGGGRGPCLNRGASLAQGRILTFLHADTRLSPNWNLVILEAFESSPEVNSCAFSFSIEKHPNPIPGIKAVEQTANWRTHWFHLPYGDQCLSIPRSVYDHVGGFPDQCLMEDYELVKLLRQRVAQLGERLAILDVPAYCSPRRWQTFGVLYVTYMNSKCVNLYGRGDITPDELFQLYYGANAPSRSHATKSPWEVELEELLGQAR